MDLTGAKSWDVDQWVLDTEARAHLATHLRQSCSCLEDLVLGRHWISRDIRSGGLLARGPMVYSFGHIARYSRDHNHSMSRLSRRK